MIAFGSAITKQAVFDTCARPGIAVAAETDSLVLDRPSVGSIFESYNALMDEAAGVPEVEALVLVHQDTEIVSPDFCATVRRTLEDPLVGVIGCVGAIGVRSIAWWEGSATCASFVHRYAEEGGGELPAFSWAWADAPPYARIGEVDTLDGFLLVMPRWTLDNLRFDASLGELHGYDLDFCMQVREAGHKAMTADFRAVHHHRLEPFTDPTTWIAAHRALAEKWAGRMPGFGQAAGDWRERALRAEAERDAARAIAHARRLEDLARTRSLEHERDEALRSVSWRVTAPLRAASRLRGATR